MKADELRYVKRWRMVAALPARGGPPPLPEGVRLAAWRPELAKAHAAATFAAFRDSPDRSIYPSFLTLDGCEGLLRELVHDAEFFPQGTWLAELDGEVVGTVQAARTGATGLLHNVGVAPHARGCGLGRALAGQALAAFRAAGLGEAALEVSADNLAAVRLYRSLGFRRREQLFRLQQA